MHTSTNASEAPGPGCGLSVWTVMRDRSPSGRFSRLPFGPKISRTAWSALIAYSVCQQYGIDPRRHARVAISLGRRLPEAARRRSRKSATGMAALSNMPHAERIFWLGIPWLGRNAFRTQLYEKTLYSPAEISIVRCGQTRSDAVLLRAQKRGPGRGNRGHWRAIASTSKLSRPG